MGYIGVERLVCEIPPLIFGFQTTHFDVEKLNPQCLLGIRVSLWMSLHVLNKVLVGSEGLEPPTSCL